MRIFNIHFTIQRALLIAVVLLALLLRVWQLDKYPAGLNADEAAIGYNAYSILNTGKDEYGTPFPLSFKSFGDFKPGLYFYFVMPSIALFGLNEWGVRLPSALFGVGLVILIYFLAKRIFKSQKVSLLAAFLLSITPWHIHFSRGGWETNVATFFMSLGVYLFIISKQRVKLLFFSLFSFLTSMYLYQSPRLVVPIFLLGLVALYRQKLQKNWKTYIVPIVLLLFLSIPLGFQFLSGGGSERFNGLSFFADPGPSNRVNELRGEHNISKSSIIFHNKVVAYGINFLGHFLDHFSPNFLFINGDPIIRNKIPETGQFYLIYAFFLIVGLINLIKQLDMEGKVLIIWLLIAPLASAMTYQTPHAVRALNMVVPFILLMAYGLLQIGVFLQKKAKGIFVLSMIFIAVALIFETVHYLESYYIHYPKRYPLSWEYGFSDMVNLLRRYEGSFEKVVITDRYDQPYILVLFYKKFDPAKYQVQAHLSPRDKFNFGTVRNFDKFEFREIFPEEVKKSKNTLFIGTEKEIPKDAQIIDTIAFPDGTPAFIFAKNN